MKRFLKVRNVIYFILIILIIIAIIIVNWTRVKAQKSKYYEMLTDNDLPEGNFTVVLDSLEYDSEITLSKQGYDYSIMSKMHSENSEDRVSRTILKNENEEKVIFVYDEKNYEESDSYGYDEEKDYEIIENLIFIKGVNRSKRTSDGIEYLTKRFEKYNNKFYYIEEIVVDADKVDSNPKFKFFFDGDNLKYIQIIHGGIVGCTPVQDGMYEIKEMNKEADDDLFKIPDNIDKIVKK